ncbi:hypothetical protein R3W88_016297 [Solanum pinnatisectum]|uniref:Reverse transcriptase zinc-binding domain-containing protein n=1 Tax=Solanum pinnatisectum TaxID=50273 RepID=A0AAV9KXF5_9SOLN|nr:hypothetical protein R3W88_016297 [Solanum pinnatisectum]
MQIKWVHNYYIKGQLIQNLALSQQASRMIRNIVAAQTIWRTTQQPLKVGQSIIQQIYLHLLEARPKAIFSLWLYLQERLLTKDRLLKWGVSVEPRYVFCNACLETRTHLFVQCSFASSLWTRIYFWIKRTTLITSDSENHLARAMRDAKGKTLKAQLFKMVYIKTIPAIWMERNQRQFEKKNRAMEMIAKDIAFTCNARAQPMISNLLQQYKFKITL